MVDTGMGVTWVPMAMVTPRPRQLTPYMSFWVWGR